jgi:hypothetical protein
MTRMQPVPRVRSSRSARAGLFAEKGLLGNLAHHAKIFMESRFTMGNTEGAATPEHGGRTEGDLDVHRVALRVPAV